MDVFAYYDCSLSAPEIQADWVPLWERSWRARGWNPRLITARHARRSKFYSRLKDSSSFETYLPFIALHSVGGGLITPLNVINFSFKVPSKGLRPVAVIRYKDEVFQAPKPALERMFRGGGFLRVDLPVGFKSFSSPEEALKFDF